MVLLAALTLYVALVGFRMMFGEAPGGRDLVGEMLKIGIVLTLATSWPAWRTVAYQVVLQGPAEITGTVGRAAGLPGSQGDLNERLDNLDQGIVSLTAFGTGRLTGGIVGTTDLGDSARGIALADQAGFAWGRVAFLTGTIGPLALIRLMAGILLALAPLMAGLLLFGGTRDIFMGWLRGLGACALGAIALSLIYGAELALLEGWLRSALSQREANVMTVAAPTELLALALAFLAATLGALALVIRLVFFASPSWRGWFQADAMHGSTKAQQSLAYLSMPVGGQFEHARAQRVADAVERVMRGETRSGEVSQQIKDRRTGTPNEGRRPAAERGVQEAFGGSVRRNQRRNHRRISGAAAKRDGAP